MINDTWKQEQLNYFEEYKKSFKKNSKEYNLIQSGIDHLEKSFK